MITILILVWIHFVADFLLQTDKMALSKSTHNGWLALHCLIYGLAFSYFGVWFAVGAGMSHFIIDYCTSRINSYLWKNEKRGMFFNCIGFDQALHMTVLLGLLHIL